MSDQIAWLSSQQRETVLQEAMGAESFAHAQEWQGPELQQLLERRKQSVQDGKDVSVMPQSWQEARERAKQLSAEVAAETAEQRRAAALAHLAEPPSPEMPTSRSSSPRSRGKVCCRAFAQKPRATGVLATKVKKAKSATRCLKAAKLGLKKVRKPLLKSLRAKRSVQDLLKAHEAKRKLS
jgi:hypothetical protein